jgi:hypothetical protein
MNEVMFCLTVWEFVMFCFTTAFILWIMERQCTGSESL